MKTSNYTWESTFLSLFERCLETYRSGNEDYSSYYSAQDLDFLAGIGYRPREFFDFVEDCGDEGEPVPACALLVAAARRDYFLHVQGGEIPSDLKIISSHDLPARDAELGGHPWFPRILVKARAKLMGALDPDIMYGCGGDRAFLSRHDIHPADFLRVVWAAGGDDAKVAAFVDRCDAAAAARESTRAPSVR